ncbi:WXG100 family type VII secretion target [Sinomonas flava]|uniref:WXG100 family type VII secretion target n=1 Tax=Sinomonas flava TaxID=496857 RepID=A0ABP5NNA7_9MICC
MTIRAGANVEELRALALQFGKASKELGSRGQELSAVLGRMDVWRGSDAEQFKQQWSRLHRPALLAVSRQLQEASRTLLANADAQEQTSEASTGALAAGAPSALGVLYDVYETAGGVKAFGSAAWNAINAGRLGLDAWKDTKSLFTSWADVGELVRDGIRGIRSGDGLSDVYQAMRAGVPYSEAFENASRFSQSLRWAGAIAGPFAVAGGIHDVISPSHDGWRGTGDRVAGGLSAVGGVGSMMLATAGGAALLGPIGAPVVIGAGLVAAGWTVGNLVYDNWDSISSFAGDVGGTIADGFGEAKDAVADTVDSVVDGVSDAAGAAKDFVGGLFG